MYRACMKWEKIRNTELFYLENFNQTNDLGKPRHMYEDNIKTYLKEVGCEVRDQ